MNTDFLNKNKKWIAVAAVVVVVLGAGLWYLNWRKGVENDGQAKQERVEQTWQSAQNSLSTCLDQGQTAAQVTDQEFTRLKELLTDVVSARYVDENGDPTSAQEALGGGSAFSAVFEAYPQIDQASFQNLQAIVVGCRDEFQNSQDRLFNEARELETWMQTDNIFNSGIKGGFPTDSLDAVDFESGEVLKGQEALDYMTRVILVGEARDAYEEGELGDQDLFEDDEE